MDPPQRDLAVQTTMARQVHRHRQQDLRMGAHHRLVIHTGQTRHVLAVDDAGQRPPPGHLMVTGLTRGSVLWLRLHTMHRAITPHLRRYLDTWKLFREFAENVGTGHGRWTI